MTAGFQLHQNFGHKGQDADRHEQSFTRKHAHVEMLAHECDQGVHVFLIDVKCSYTLKRDDF